MNENFLKMFNKIALYTVIYTAVFLFISLSMPYILPFVLGTIIALTAQPLINFLTRQLKIKRSIIGISVVLIIFAALFGIITLIIVNIVRELTSIASYLPDFFAKASDFIMGLIDKATPYISSMDPNIVSGIQSSASKLFSGSFSAAVFIVNYIINILKSFPGILMLILFTLLTAVYVAIDMPMLKSKVLSLFTAKDGSRVRQIVAETNKMLGNYMKAYLILITVTFFESYLGLSLLKIRYSLLISIIVGIADLLPILGPGTLLIPMGVILILQAVYVKGIGILILYLIVTIVRQVLEPKVLSSTLGIYPLSIIAAIFIGLKAYGFTGMIFTVFYVVFYNILKRVGVL